MRKIVFLLILAVTGVVFFQYRSDSWPFAQQKPVEPPTVRYDQFGRLIHKPVMNQTHCPVQDKRTAVILSIGQSNSANSGAQKVRSGFGGRIVNYFEGKCFIAESPLLGGSGDRGEWNTLLANKLIEQDLYEHIVIISAGITASTIDRWAKGGDLNTMLLGVLSEAKTQYKVDFVIWHHGESDYLQKTGGEHYSKSLDSLLMSLRESGVTAPVFMSIATQCASPDWYPNNGIAKAQEASIGHFPGVVAGANTDKLLGPWDRDADGCHFAGSGQEKVASYIAALLRKSVKLSR